MRNIFLFVCFYISIHPALYAQVELKQGLTLSYITRDYGYVMRPELPKKEDKAVAARKEFNEKMIKGDFDDLTTTSTLKKVIKDYKKQDTTETFLVEETKTESKNGQKLETKEERAWIYTPTKSIWVPQASPRKSSFKGGETVIDMGPWEFPAKPQVGDVLKMVYNCMYTYLEGTIIGTRDVITGYTSEAYTKTDFGFFDDGGMKYGKYTETGTRYKPIIEQVSAEVATKVEGSVTTYNRANAEITGTTDYTINGKKYTAYIVNSESWVIPMTIKMTAQSNDELIEANKQKIMNKTAKRINGKERGYIVQDIVEYVVPELGGSVKTIVYQDGYVKFITSLTDVK